MSMRIQPKDPDPSHMIISFIKSGIRIVAGCVLIASGFRPEFIMYAGLLLVIAELLGIAEEIV